MLEPFSRTVAASACPARQRVLEHTLALEPFPSPVSWHPRPQYFLIRSSPIGGARSEANRLWHRELRRIGDSDIPHRLATNNRKVKISYPGPHLSRNTQPVDVMMLTDGAAIWHAKCIRDRRLPVSK